MKTIYVITGSRAEYGLLRKLIMLIDASSFLRCRLIVTGMHLSSEFGKTIEEIESDGIEIFDTIEMLLSSDSNSSITKSIGLGLIGFADLLKTNKPDLILILGDRFEILTAAIAATIENIPIAHLHGGELTRGVYDDPIRHSITKMSSLHFVATEPYRNRVLQMGEHPSTVWNVGAFGIDAINDIETIPRKNLEIQLCCHFAKQNMLVTYHPETMTGESSEEQILEVIYAISNFEGNIFFTLPNADSSNAKIKNSILEFVSQNPERAFAFKSLGQKRYLSLMSEVDVVVGNSSSGIIEAPSIRVPSINIGRRQEGRIHAKSVVNSNINRDNILDAIQQALLASQNPSHNFFDNPYGSGGASLQTLQILEQWVPKKRPKKFFDIIWDSAASSMSE